MTLDDALKLYAYDGILHLACKERYDILQQMLDVPFDPDVHYTLSYIHLFYAMLDIGKKLLEHAPDKKDETYKELEDFHNALEECENSHFSVFPLHVNYRNWWNGPHLSFPNPDKITQWRPLRVDCLHQGGFYSTYAQKEGDKIAYYTEAWFPSNKALTPPEFDLMGEVVFYGNDESADYRIDFHREKIWKHNPALKVVVDRAEPIIKRSDSLLNERIKEELNRK